jgi:hypothetical protein
VNLVGGAERVRVRAAIFVRAAIGAMLIATMLVALQRGAASDEPTPSPSCTGSFEDGSIFSCPQQNALTVDLLGRARRHDVAGVLAYGPRLEGPTSDRDGLERITYELALVTADPTRFSARFIRTLMNANFIQYHVIGAYADAGLVAKDAPNAIVLARARAGDPYADAVILSSTIHPLNEYDPGFDATPVVADQRRLFAALRVMPRSSVYAYFCTARDVQRDPEYIAREVASLRPRDAFERDIVAGLRAAARSCTAYDANA